MRLVQIKLPHSHSFWFLNDQIRLNANHRISDFINIDSLDEEDCKIINDSAQNLTVQLFDYDGRRVKSLEELFITIDGESVVSVEDVEESSSPFPEMVSVTVTEEEEPEEEAEIPDYSEEAEILLGRNGHTVKKAVANLPKEEASLYLLHAMLEIENMGKQRKGVIQTITTAIGEF